MSLLLGSRTSLFIISAPSGGGKTTLVNEVTSLFPNQLFRVVTCTTREPRKGEVNGKDYFFLTEADFEKKRLNGEFLESTKTYGYSYGTLKKSIEESKTKGSLLLVIDVKGALQILKEFPCVSIFIQPPSLKELERRIRNRMEENEEELKKRLLSANEELEKAVLYDYNLVNDDFSAAVEIIKSIIIAESFRRI